MTSLVKKCVLCDIFLYTYIIASTHYPFMYLLTFNLILCGIKQMLSPLLILKFTWSNNNKMKHSEFTFKIQAIKFHLAQDKGKKVMVYGNLFYNNQIKDMYLS
jgi:predicted phage tail protein